MHDVSRASESAVWAAAEGTASDDQIAVLEADLVGWRRILSQLLDEAEDGLEAVRQLNGPERAQVVADFEEQFALLEAAYDRLVSADDPTSAVLTAEPTGEVRLQASWAAGQIVVWAAAPNADPEDNDALASGYDATYNNTAGRTADPGATATLPTGWSQSTAPGSVRASTPAPPSAVACVGPRSRYRSRT